MGCCDQQANFAMIRAVIFVIKLSGRVSKFKNGLHMFSLRFREYSRKISTLVLSS